MTELTMRVAADATELQQYAAAMGSAFNVAPPNAFQWVNNHPRENVRVACRGGHVVGGLAEVPMGQWFGGHVVSMLGIAGVAVPPEARGQGVALALMRDTLTLARERGVSLSALYPATIALYRAAGYELAGSYCRWSVPLASCPRRKTALEIRPITDTDRSDVVQAYRTVARSRTGHLERGPYVWSRVRSPKGELAKGYVVLGEQGVEGYVFLVQSKQSREFHYDLALSDLVALNGAALDGLLRFFADHRSMADHVVWYGGLTHPALFALPERGLTVQVHEHWMLRLVHVEQALGERGYPDVDAELVLEVKDDILTENSGSYYIQIKHGGAGIEPLSRRGGATTLQRAVMDVRALAALYSGFSSPEELARSGALDADARTLSALSLLFSGPPPSMCDFF